jgi:cytochrome c551/c552
MRLMRHAMLAAAVALLAACAVPTAWSSELSKRQKMALMKQRVLPTLGPVFAAHDPTRYAKHGCVTCHGPDDKDPHDYLPRLTVKDGTLTAFTEKPEIAKFMANEVVPNMASAMGVPSFGCGGCHAVDEAR